MFWWVVIGKLSSSIIPGYLIHLLNNQNEMNAITKLSWSKVQKVPYY